MGGRPSIGDGHDGSRSLVGTAEQRPAVHNASLETTYHRPMALDRRQRLSGAVDGDDAISRVSPRRPRDRDMDDGRLGIRHRQRPIRQRRDVTEHAVATGIQQCGVAAHLCVVLTASGDIDPRQELDDLAATNRMLDRVVSGGGQRAIARDHVIVAPQNLLQRAIHDLHDRVRWVSAEEGTEFCGEPRRIALCGRPPLAAARSSMASDPAISCRAGTGSASTPDHRDRGLPPWIKHVGRPRNFTPRQRGIRPRT